MKAQQKSKAGFTLVEVMVSTVIGVILLTSTYATVMSLAKGSESMINFSEMNSQTRIAIELFGRDSRMAEEVKSATTESLRMAWDVSINGTSYTNDVEYTYVPSAGTFTRTTYRPNGTVNDTRILLYDVQDMDFNYYTLLHSSTTNLLDIKHVQLEAKLEREVLRITNTNYIISARFMMRNRDVSN